MNVLIVTFGSRGDVQPYIALGQGLRAAGHQVTVCTSALFQSFVTAHGLNYGYMNNELLQLLDSDAGRDAVDNTDNLWGTVQTTVKLFKYVKPMQRQTLYDIWQTAQTVNPAEMRQKAAALAARIQAEDGIGDAMVSDLPSAIAVIETLTAERDRSFIKRN